MATLRATLLENFATIGIPDYDEEEAVNKSWSIVGLSENLIDEKHLAGIQHLNTRRLDLVIHNGSKFALLNLQAFKIFECELATKTIKKCIAHHLTPDGKLLFGLEPSGNVIILTDGFQKLKRIRKPAFLKIYRKQSRWYKDIFGKIVAYFTGRTSKINQVTPEPTLQHIKISGPYVLPTTSSSLAWWETTAISSFSLMGLTDNLKSQFPYLTSLINGLAILCAFSPTDCYIFTTNYDTSLKVKSISNVKQSQVSGRWYRVIMHKSFVARWLEDKRTTPCFEARLCYTTDENTGDSLVGGAMLYGVMENLRLEIVYGIIKKTKDKYTLSWESLQFDVDWALRESDGLPYSLGARFVTKLSSDCTKMIVVISNHLGIYMHVQEIPFYSDEPIQLVRQKVSLCNHSDYDGFHFYKQDCWVSDVQWLADDAYFAVITLCGSLSIFHNSGEPMIIKIRRAGPEPDNKSARFFFPVFSPHQIATGQKHCQRNNGQPGSTSSQQIFPAAPVYPILKWVESEQVLTCSSGMKMELFSIERVIPIHLNKEQSEIWLGRSIPSDLPCLTRGKRQIDDAVEYEDEEYETASESNYDANRPQPNSPQRLIPSVKVLTKPKDENIGGSPTESCSGESIAHSDDNENEYVTLHSQRANDTDSEGVKNLVNDVEIPSHIEELPLDGGEVAEENCNEIPSPEKLRHTLTAGCIDKDPKCNFCIEDASNIKRGFETPAVNLSDSLAEVVAYNQEYSDGSSEPDFDATFELPVELSKSPLQENGNVPVDFDHNANSVPFFKLSQPYMADDEADDEVNMYRVPNRKSPRWKATTKKAMPPCLPRDSSHKRANTGGVVTPDDESDHPRSSSANSQETYSSPFSYAPTTAENNNEEDVEQISENDHHELPIVEKKDKTSSAIAAPVEDVSIPLATASTSQSSTVTNLSLRIPPVPQISGVIIPSERQSSVLLQNIERDSLMTQQPVLMKYKPPLTISTCEINTGTTGRSKPTIRSSHGTEVEKVEVNVDVTTASNLNRSFKNKSDNCNSRQP